MKRSKAKSPGKRPARRAAARRPAAAEPTGRVHLYVGVSLDGYLAGPNGELGWLDPYADARAGFGPFIKTIGSTIMGRATYDYAVSHGFGDFGETPAYVVTHRPFTPPSKSVIPYHGNLRDLVVQARQRHPRDIWLMGGGSLAKAFLEEDLIDIWSVAFVPTLLGAGIPMFPSRPHQEQRLQLVRQHAYPSGVIELRYERAAPRR